MSLRIAIVVAVATLTLAPFPVLADGCLDCHIDEDMTDRGRGPALAFAGDVHAAAKLSCADCHGGLRDTVNFKKAHGKADGFRGRPGAAEISATCGRCHDDAERMKTAMEKGIPIGQGRRFRESVHGKVRDVKGFELPSCVSCHGVHGIRPKSDPESKTHPSRVPGTCARCHGDLGYMRAFTSARVRVDQLLEYRTSVHGQLLEKGDVKVAVCSSCHSAHDIRPATDMKSSVHPLKVAETCGRCHSDPAYMAGYEVPARDGSRRPIPTDQRERYTGSVHQIALTEKGDLSAPTCNDCHGNHGATPPEVRTVATVCSQCHSRPAELFAESPLREELAAIGQKGCATCHGHHRIEHPGEGLLEEIGGGETSSGWKPGEAYTAIAQGFLDSIRGLERSIDDAEARVAKTEDYGMDLTRARLRLTQARDKLIQARVMVHAFRPERMEEIVAGTEDERGATALVAEAGTLVEAALEERSFRRTGLVVSLGIILLLIAGLVVKIRRMER